jgi:acyl-CoA reductase-like NAD-dependent aldehyde dehydrogenase
VASTDTHDGRLLIGGTRTAGASRLTLRDPYRNEPIADVDQAGQQDVDQAVTRARHAQPAVAAMPIHQRSAILHRAADLLADRTEMIASTISRQTGKAIRDARREVSRGAYTLRGTAAAVDELRGEIVPTEATPGGEGLIGMVLREPLGVIAAITPFNAPFNLMMHKVAPAFGSGNAVVVKSPPQAPLTGLQLGELMYDAGVPPDALSILSGGADTGAALVAHAGVDAISFTGSRVAGEAIVRTAGVKRTLLELGGNAPNLVHSDADLEWAAKALVPGAFSNTGQSCHSVQRILVHQSVIDHVAQLMTELAGKLVVGDPLEEATQVGTMVDEAAAARLEAWIGEAVDGGAQVLVGGRREGALFFPTLLRNTDPAMRIVCEEAFGPVAVLIPYEELDEAIDAANATEYGLQAAIFTSSLDVAMRAARGIKAGGVMVNRSSNFRLDSLPFGGFKASGNSREGGRYTVEAMTERKLILIDHSLLGAPHPLAGSRS